MLLSYSFSNFHSFADKAEVSFVLTQRDTATGWYRTTKSGKRVSTVMSVMGANGAGKSNLLKVGNFIGWFISDSFLLPPEGQLQFMPHMTGRDEPSEFKVVYEDDDGAEWIYELKVRANRVEYESLYRKDLRPGSRPTRVFSRQAKGDTYEVAQDFGLAESEAAKVRPNVSLISWAKQYGSETASRVATISLATNLEMWGRKHQEREGHFGAAEYFGQNESHQESMRKLMKHWDFGLSDVRIERYSAMPQSGTSEPTTTWFAMGLHEADDKKFELPFMLESSGTQTAFMLLWRLLPILERGGLALMDEFEADLHPHMVEPLVRLFHDIDTNPHGAQLVFTCHSPEMLRSLHRAQVTFVEKHQCKSEAYRGDAIEGLNSQHNLYNKYLSGALGAVPQV